MTNLVPLGFFRELRHGHSHGPKLMEVIRPTAGANDAAIVAYLQNGVALMIAPGFVRDVLVPDSGPVASLSILTDGMYAWPSDLAHYVELHHARLPAEFVAHAAERGWQVPPVDKRALSFR